MAIDVLAGGIKVLHKSDTKQRALSWTVFKKECRSMIEVGCLGRITTTTIKNIIRTLGLDPPWPIEAGVSYERLLTERNQ